MRGGARIPCLRQPGSAGALRPGESGIGRQVAILLFGRLGPTVIRLWLLFF